MSDYRQSTFSAQPTLDILAFRNYQFSQKLSLLFIVPYRNAYLSNVEL